MSKYTLKTSPHQIETFQSSESILNRILEINKEFLAKKITAVQIEKQNGEILMVTIGSDYHLLNYYPKDYSNTGTGSVHSISPDLDSRNGSDTFDYFYFGHHSEGLLKWTIDRNTTLNTIKEFLQREGIPNKINWEPD